MHAIGVAIVSAGAVPLLVQMRLGRLSIMAQVSATRMLKLALNAEDTSCASAGAIPLLVRFLDSGDGPPAAIRGGWQQGIVKYRC
jgi:hypothetical protein